MTQGLAGSPLDGGATAKGGRGVFVALGSRCLTGEGVKKQAGQTGLAERFRVRERGSGTPFFREGDCHWLTLGPSPLSLQPHCLVLQPVTSPPCAPGTGAMSILPAKLKDWLPSGSTQTRLGSWFAFEGKVRMHLQGLGDQGQGCRKGETEELSSSSLAFYLLILEGTSHLWFQANNSV